MKDDFAQRQSERARAANLFKRAQAGAAVSAPLGADDWPRRVKGRSGPIRVADNTSNIPRWGPAQPSDSQWVPGVGSTTWPYVWTDVLFEEEKKGITPVAEEDGAIPGYTLQGDFQGESITVADIGIDESPIEAVIHGVFGLEEDDTIESVAIRRKDGRMEIKSWDEVRQQS